MNNINLNYAYWFVANIAKKLGSWGLIGLALIIGSLLFYSSNIPQIEALTEEAITSKQKLDADIANNSAFVEATKPQQNLEDISRFYEIFPSADALPQALATIYKIANQQKLALNSGDYKFNKIKEKNISGEKKLTKYEIVLPIKGQYIQIKAFIHHVLQQIRPLALIDMQLRRESSVNQTIDARLVFVIFVRSDS
jgi:Tfp pilus assembly protein PilO